MCLFLSATGGLDGWGGNDGNNDVTTILMGGWGGNPDASYMLSVCNSLTEVGCHFYYILCNLAIFNWSQLLRLKHKKAHKKFLM